MNALIAAARAVHFGSAILLFGELVFAFAIRWPIWRVGDRAMRGDGEDVAHDALRVARWSLVASVVAAIAWLALEAASMSGLPIDQALSRDTLERVLAETTFGRVWLLRLLFAAGCGMALFAMRSGARAEHIRRWAMVAIATAAAYLAALAWTGHAGAAEGTRRYVQLCADVVHLIAAGAWLGALPGLVLVLGRSRSIDDSTRTVRRFSTMGLVCVAALVVTGAINAWFLVGSVPALFATDYGRLLLAKLSLLAVMVALAAVNRLSLTPRLAARDIGALRALRRNAALEIVAGLLVVIIVGVLGITIPAAHQSTVLPSAPMQINRPGEPAQDAHMH